MTLMASYDPKAMIIKLNGEDVYGFAEGDMVTVERNEEFFNIHQGTQGEISRAFIRNNSYRITIRLQHTSPFIQRLENYKTADSLLKVPPVMVFQVIDPSSYEQLFAAQCWIQADPSRNWGNEIGVREYQLFAAFGVTAPNTPSALLNVAGALGLGL